MYAQQVLVNAVVEYRDVLMQRSIALDRRVDPPSIEVGQQVLIDWSGEDNAAPPSKLHPLFRGPYLVVKAHDNVITLQHSHVPPPPNQPASLVWSRHARIYDCEFDSARSPLDPSAVHVPITSASFGIDCILSHRLDETLPETVTRSPHYSIHDAHYQLYEVRYHHSNAPGFVKVAWRHYEDIAHCLAADNYIIGNPHLHSHRPCRSMPENWNSRKEKPGSRMVLRASIGERTFPSNSVSSQDSIAFSDND